MGSNCAGFNYVERIGSKEKFVVIKIIVEK